MDQDAFKLRSGIATVLLTAALVVIPAITQAASRDRQANSLKFRGMEVTDDQGRIQVFVRLDEPAVAELNAASVNATGSFASASAQREQAARVSQQQARVKPLIAGQGA
jgi:hypothetical protein